MRVQSLPIVSHLSADGLLGIWRNGQTLEVRPETGRDGRIRTGDPLTPSQVR
jgi:hypothetical protein